MIASATIQSFEASNPPQMATKFGRGLPARDFAICVTNAAKAVLCASPMMAFLASSRASGDFLSIHNEPITNNGSPFAKMINNPIGTEFGSKGYCNSESIGSGITRTIGFAKIAMIPVIKSTIVIDIDSALNCIAIYNNKKMDSKRAKAEIVLNALENGISVPLDQESQRIAWEFERAAKNPEMKIEDKVLSDLWVQRKSQIVDRWMKDGQENELGWIYGVELIGDKKGSRVLLDLDDELRVEVDAQGLEEMYKQLECIQQHLDQLT